MSEKQNAKQLPRTYYTRHFQPGIVGYEEETVLVDTAAVKSMVPTGINKPVYVHHQPVNLEKLEAEACGYITESFYNELDGWGWFKILVVSDEGHQAIQKGWRVSNAYQPTQWGNGGTKNNLPYNREVLNGEFTHLAIVPNPRYEEAIVMTPEEFRNYQDLNKRQLEELHNSKSKSEGKPMFNLFKNSREKIENIDMDTLTELEGGVTVSLAECIEAKQREIENAKKGTKKNSEEKEEKKVKETAKAVTENSDMMDVDGVDVPVSDMVNAYKEKMNAEKKNAEEAEAKKKADDEKANKKNDDDENKAKEEEEAENEKKNSKHFDELRNAAMKAPTQTRIIETSMDRLARGQARYGSQA